MIVDVELLRRMANFKTHIGVAAAASGMLSTACLGAGIADPADMVVFAVAGTAGGILPDIDSDHSSPMKILFTGLGLLAAALTVVAMANRAPIAVLWVGAAAAYCAVRYLGWKAFAQWTVHRGIFHSLVAAAFFCFGTCALAYNVFGQDALRSWATGAFVGFGYTVHLLLDEMFSVDMMNARVKRSFGTALKAVDYSDWHTSVAFIAAALAAYLCAPAPGKFLAAVTKASTYERVGERLLAPAPAVKSRGGRSGR